MHLFFFALLPPADLQAEVTAFKESARERFGSGHALRSPPHVTLVPPFRSPLTDFPTVERFAAGQIAFPVRLRHFARFDQRVIYVDVVADEPLRACQRDLAQFCEEQFGISRDSRPFHPHMTVAFRDLSRAVFPDAWAYFSSLAYERTFVADRLTLLRHTGDRWQIAHEWPLTGLPSGE